MPEDNAEVTDVFFAIHGANLNLDAAGNVETVIDAGGIYEFYVALCEAAGHERPPVIGAPQQRDPRQPLRPALAVVPTTCSRKSWTL